MTEDLTRNSIIPSTIIDDTVLASSQFAISLHNKGFYGIPEENGLRLNGFEALHLLELGRIEIKNHDLILKERDLVKYFSELIPNFMNRYLVYKDLRNRGYILNIGQGSSFFFRLYARNSKPKKDGALYYVTPLKEGGSIQLAELEELVKTAKKSKKILLFAMVDAIGDVSYLQVTRLIPEDLSETKKFANLENWEWETAWEEYKNEFSLDDS